MFKRILLALDRSPLAEQAIPYTQQIARAFSANVTLVSIANRDDTDVGLNRAGQSVARELRRVEGYLGKHQKALAGQGVTTDVALSAGKPADEIVRAATGRGCDLICMTTRGRSGVGRWMLGSTADKVLHTTRVPMLLMRPADSTAARTVQPIRRIVVPLDGSALAESVLPSVLELAKTMSVNIALLRVVPSSAFAMVGAKPRGVEPRGEPSPAASAADYLNRVAQRLQQQALKVTINITSGDTAGEIIDAARAEPGTLIAMCTHGRSGVGRLVLGSIADRVVRQGGEPVLVFHAATVRKAR
ncbi:MAG: universal stress protein [Chloroflexi bacterium]|nr:universal stress protein [Chloroflexota bacterium]